MPITWRVNVGMGQLLLKKAEYQIDPIVSALHMRSASSRSVSLTCRETLEGNPPPPSGPLSL